MFKKRQQWKELTPSKRSLTSLEYGGSFRPLHTVRVGGTSKESKKSLKSQRRKPSSNSKPTTKPLKNKLRSKSKEFNDERIIHQRCQSVDLMGEYEKMLAISKKMEARSSGKKHHATTHTKAPAEVPYYIQPIYNNALKQSEKQPFLFQQQLESYGSCKPQPATIAEYDDLICDEELDTRTPFPILRTPQRLVQTSSMLDRYGLSELSVVEERIISEEEKQFVSDKKKKAHGRMPTLSTAEKILCSANTATTIREIDRPQRSTSPFEVGSKPKKPQRISINVNALVGKSKKARHK